MSSPLPLGAQAPAHHAAVATYHGGDADGDDGDDPCRRKRLPSAHEVDAPPGTGSRMKNVWRQRRPSEGTPIISEKCPLCLRCFGSSNALHGHMRMHPESERRRVLPPKQRQPKKLSEEKKAACLLITLFGGPNAGTQPEFECMCGRKFDSHQALGGHRACHRSVKGCYAIGRGQSSNARGKGEGRKNVAVQRHKGKEKLEEGPAMEKKKDNANASQAQTSWKGKEVVIDLNLPASEDDESSPEIDLNRNLEQ